MKILSQINVFNSEEYLWYVLKSIYYHVDRIVVIDGAFRDDMPSKYSTDRTASIVQGFDDHLNKIIYLKSHSASQKEQRNKIFDFTAGMDWLILIDDDEIYKQGGLFKLRKFLNKTKDNVFRIKGFNFVNSFDWYYETANTRVWRIVKNMRFKGPNTIIPYIDCRNAPVIKNVIRYHYSYVRDPHRLEIKMKQIGEFQQVKSFPWRREGEFIIRDSWNKKQFKGQHPSVLDKHPYRERVWNPE